MLDWHQELLAWYAQSKRDLPWRKTSDPYAIWVSEIMLQQTQVATVVPYYTTWMARWPTVQALAAANEAEVLTAWAGLGYYRRAKMLLQGAKYVAEAGMPGSHKEWLKVPGVGAYTAGAICSIALGIPEPLVDGNVERVFARLTACDLESAELHRATWNWAAENLDSHQPGDWNQALMELGATLCTPQQPACERCPVRTTCRARAEARVSELPRAKKRREVIPLQRTIFVPIRDGKLGLRRIPEGEWWAGMWEFPNVKQVPESAQPLMQFSHQVTHHKITVNASIGELKEEWEVLEWFTAEQVKGLPLPASQKKLFQAALKQLSSEK